jgi:glyoxylase-like metal-dependent hydrolase (beta-lactamase superfamily II)
MRPLIGLIAALALSFDIAAAGSPPSPQLRLYVMDCGRAEFKDLGPFSDTGDYEGHPGTLTTPCFLVRHPKGDLLWEAGLGDKYASDPAGVVLPNYRAVVPRTVESQLRELGLGFADVDYFAFSHGHADHLGNADKLGAATWIVNAKELAWMESKPAPPRTNTALIAARVAEKTLLINGDHDVFGDGSVRILAAPGHTPGHQVLLVQLPRQGAVLLSGDLYHTEENRRQRRMPVFNVSRADTLASMERIELILRNRPAKLVIQHSADAFRALPHSPQFID